MDFDKIEEQIEDIQNAAYSNNIGSNEEQLEVRTEIVKLLKEQVNVTLGSVSKRYSDEFTPPFRVGRKQKRAVLDSKGKEVIVFPNSDGQAEKYCEYLNVC